MWEQKVTRKRSRERDNKAPVVRIERQIPFKSGIPQLHCILIPFLSLKHLFKKSIILVKNLQKYEMENPCTNMVSVVY